MRGSLTLALVPHPTGVCVAGYGGSDRNEILQLLPPPTLQAKETQVGAAAGVASQTQRVLASSGAVSDQKLKRIDHPAAVQLGGSLVVKSCCPADSVCRGSSISRCVNESFSWGKGKGEETRENKEGTG